MAFCPRCGLQVDPQMVFCPRCGLQLYSGSQYSGGGYQFPQIPQQTQPPPGGWGQQRLPPRTIEEKRMAQAYPDRKYPQLQQTITPADEQRMRQERKDRLAQQKANAQRPPAHAATPEDPDPEFSKFVDAPQPPLPFFIGKILMGILSLLGAGLLLFKCYKLETFMWLATHARENIPGVPLLAFAVFLILAALTCFLSKHNRTIAGVGGVLFFLAAGFGYVYHGDYSFLLGFSVISGVFGIIMLISAAGGVQVNLDE